jgi:transposase-like protein
MEKDYQVVDASSKLDSRELAEFLSKDGQLLLPLLDLITQGQRAVDEVIDVMGRATIEAILKMSAEEVAGPRQQGKASDRPYYWHGTQPGRVTLAERQLRVDKPRLRKRKSIPGEQAEVDIPAYEALRKDHRLADRMLGILMRGVSTRNYREVLPEMAEQVGVSKSQVSRENIEAGERLLKELTERDFSQHDLLIIYIDGLRFGEYLVIAAVGVDAAGQKHVLALRPRKTRRSPSRSSKTSWPAA